LQERTNNTQVPTVKSAIPSRPQGERNFTQGKFMSARRKNFECQTWKGKGETKLQQKILNVDTSKEKRGSRSAEWVG
jgi:hypothetical protein